MRSVSPNLGWGDERVVAEEQVDYMPVSATFVIWDDNTRSIVTRWTFTPEERQRIANGEDVYFAQVNFGNPMIPIQVGLREHFTLIPEDHIK